VCVCVCVSPVVQDQEADNGGGFFGQQWDQGQQCDDHVTQQGAQVSRLHAPHEALPRPVHRIGSTVCGKKEGRII